MTAAELILRKADGTFEVAPLGDYLNTVALRHTDYKGDIHVVTNLSEDKLGKLSLTDRQLFGEQPVVMSSNQFKNWLSAYLGSTSDGLRRYTTLKKAGIPFTARNVQHLLDDSGFQWRASVADMFLKHDLEKKEALVNIGRKAQRVDVSDHGGSYVTGRWFAFDTVEDAALVKLMYSTKDVTVLLIEL